MSLIGNILWVILFGWWHALLYLVFGAVFCVTIIGIPIGKAMFQYAKLMFAPFGKAVIRESTLKGAKNVSIIRKIGGVILNVIWFPVGLIMAVIECVVGVLCFVTIILIPVGFVCFRSATFLIAPIGAKVVPKETAVAAKANAQNNSQSSVQTNAQ